MCERNIKNNLYMCMAYTSKIMKDAGDNNTHKQLRKIVNTQELWGHFFSEN